MCFSFFCLLNTSQENVQKMYHGTETLNSTEVKYTFNIVDADAYKLKKELCNW